MWRGIALYDVLMELEAKKLQRSVKHPVGCSKERSRILRHLFPLDKITVR